MQFKQLLAVVAIGTAFAAPAYAAQITDASSISNKKVQTFDDAAAYDTSFARVQIGATLGVDLGLSAVGGTLNFGAPYGAWSLSGNGEWTSAATFAGVDGGFQDQAGNIAASLMFDFGGKTVQSFGAYVNYDNSFTYGAGSPLPLYMAAYDKNGIVIEEAWFTVDTPAGINKGAFFGLDVGSADVARIEISAPYAVVDNFTFSTPVPEPETYALFLAGLGLLGVIGSKRRA